MQKNSITNKITPCCGLPFSVMYWWVSNLTLNSEADRQFILSKISQNGTLSIDGWKVLVNSGTLESDASLTKAEFLAWFDCNNQPTCEQLKLIIEGFKVGNWTPETELPSNLALIDKIVNGQNLNGNVYTKEQVNQLLTTSFGGDLVISDNPQPTSAKWYFAKESGTYPNAGGLVVDLSGKLVILNYDGTTWSKVDVEIPKGQDGKTIEVFNANSVYQVGSQIFYEGKIYEVNAVTTAGQTPRTNPEKFTLIFEGMTISDFDVNKIYTGSSLVFYKGQIWELPQGEVSQQTYPDQKNSIEKPLQNVSNINFPKVASPMSGYFLYSDYTTKAIHVSKLRVKAATAGKLRIIHRVINGAITEIGNFDVVVGWNDISVSVDIPAGRLIGIDRSSTASFYWIDGNGGDYWGNSQSKTNGNVSLEVYSLTESSKWVQKTFDDLSQIKYSQSKIERLTDKTNKIYGVVSNFFGTDLIDELSNNEFTPSANGIITNAEMNSYNWSVAIKGKVLAQTTICKIDLGIEVLQIYSGGVGIAITGKSGGVTIPYNGIDLTISLKANAYFLTLEVNGVKNYYLWKNKKATKFDLEIFTNNPVEVSQATIWNRCISAKRITDYSENGNPFVLSSSEDKLHPQEGVLLAANVLDGNPYYDPNVYDGNANGIFGEQSLVKFKGKYFLYFTAAKSSPTAFVESGIAVAVSNRPDGGFMMVGNDVVIGGGRNKAGVGRAMAAWAGVIGDYVYVFAAMDYVTSQGSKIFKSSDGVNFTLVGNFITATQIARAANISIYPEKQSNGYYYGIIEGSVSGLWEMNLVKSQDFESGWTVVGKIQGVKPFGNDRMAGGPNLHKSVNGDRWILFYHAAHIMGGNVPTSNFHAFSTEIEPLNWTDITMDLEITDELDEYNAYNVDQVATPFIYQEDGKLYYSYCIAQNAPTLHTQLRVCYFNGTLDEFVGITPIYREIE